MLSRQLESVLDITYICSRTTYDRAASLELGISGERASRNDSQCNQNGKDPSSHSSVGRVAVSDGIDSNARLV